MSRSLSRRGLLLAGPALLGGCGFRPVYMPTASGKAGPARRGLAATYVRIIPERPGQLLRLALQELFESDTGLPSQYDLAVSYRIQGESIAIRESSIPTRVRFIGNASWSLLAHDAKSSRLTSGNARAMDGIDIFDSQYFAADLETEVAQKRIADRIALQISNQLGSWFRQQADKQAG